MEDQKEHPTVAEGMSDKSLIPANPDQKGNF